MGIKSTEEKLTWTIQVNIYDQLSPAFMKMGAPETQDDNLPLGL